MVFINDICPSMTFVVTFSHVRVSLALTLVVNSDSLSAVTSVSVVLSSERSATSVHIDVVIPLLSPFVVDIVVGTLVESSPC